jgi:hypothetical protein
MSAMIQLYGVVRAKLTSHMVPSSRHINDSIPLCFGVSAVDWDVAKHDDP